MSNTQNTGVNKLLLLSTMLLIVFGIFVVYTATSPRALLMGKSPEYYLVSHCTKVLACLVAMFFGARVDYSIWKKASRVIFILGCALTFAAIVKGWISPTTAVKGANRWIMGIQPSEIMKLGFILMIATKLSDAGTEIKSITCSLKQPAVPLLIVTALLVLQPNYSMLIMFCGIMLSMLFVAGARLKYVAQGFGVYGAVGAVGLLIKTLLSSKEKKGFHVADRIGAFFNPSEHHNGVEQGLRSLEALGNGGVLGTGAGNGSLKYGYLPEAHKDVVYSVIGEEFGFLGTAVVLGVFAIIFYQGFEIAKNCQTRFGKCLAVALTISLFLNFIVHVCVCTGLIPTTGQPLPFLSFGGTNLIVSGLFIGILLNISKSGTGKNIDEAYSGGERTSVYTFGGFDIARTET
jgi:cell division protein FtsW